MRGRRVLLYFAWSRPEETGAPLAVIEDRFPAIFELSTDRLDVLVRQKIDLTAPPHPFTQGGRSSFDALLQSRPDTFGGKLLICDTTMFSSTAGGVENLRRFWANVMQRPDRR
jgi:hypothetical protein